MHCISPVMARFRRERRGRACLLCPGISDVNLFRYRKRIIHFDAKVSDGAFDLGVAEQELDGPQIAGSAVDQRCFCSPQRVRAKDLWVQADAGEPFGEKPRVLPRAHAPV